MLASYMLYVCQVSTGVLEIIFNDENNNCLVLQAVEAQMEWNGYRV